MDKFVIRGGRPLNGQIAVSGAKNSALPALAASLLTAEPVVLRRIPGVRDIRTMTNLIAATGATVSVDGETVEICAANVERAEAPYELVKTMRASSLVLGPLVAPAAAVRGFRCREGAPLEPARSTSTCTDSNSWGPPSRRIMAILRRRRRVVS